MGERQAKSQSSCSSAWDVSVRSAASSFTSKLFTGDVEALVSDNKAKMREIVHIQTGQCGNQIGAKVSWTDDVFMRIKRKTHNLVTCSCCRCQTHICPKFNPNSTRLVMCVQRMRLSFGDRERDPPWKRPANAEIPQSRSPAGTLQRNFLNAI